VLNAVVFNSSRNRWRRLEISDPLQFQQLMVPLLWHTCLFVWM